MQSALSAMTDNLTATSTTELMPPMPALTRWSMAQVSVLLLLFAFALMSNCRTLCIVTEQRKSRHQPATSQLVQHLLISDILVAIFCLLGDALWLLTVEWVAGDVMCRMFKFLQCMALASSTFVTMVIAVDRCRAVTNPFSFGGAQQDQLRRRMLAGAWIASIIVSLPQLVQFKEARGPWETDFYQCVSIAMSAPEGWAGIVHQLQLAYMIFNILVMFIVPTTVLTVAYGRLIRTIIVTMRQFDNFTTPSKCQTVIDNSDNTQLTAVSTAAQQLGGRGLDADRATAMECREANSYINSSRKSLLQRAKLRSFQMFSVIILAFVLLWLPYWVLYILTCVGKLSDGQYQWLIERMSEYIFFFGMSTSAINPIVYGAFNGRRCRCCCLGGGGGGGDSGGGGPRPRAFRLVVQVAWSNGGGGCRRGGGPFAEDAAEGGPVRASLVREERIGADRGSVQSIEDGY